MLHAIMTAFLLTAYISAFVIAYLLHYSVGEQQ